MATPEGVVQVAVDGAGKMIDMGRRQSTAADDVYVQRAELVGDPAECMREINETMKRQLAVMRAILYVLSDGDVSEEQFL